MYTHAGVGQWRGSTGVRYDMSIHVCAYIFKHIYTYMIYVRESTFIYMQVTGKGGAAPEKAAWAAQRSAVVYSYIL